MNLSDKKSRRKTGHKYELMAERFLTSKGYKILERNWQAGHREIDLIALKDNTVIFIEVKAAISRAFGHPIEKVNRSKRDNLIKAARDFIERKNFRGCDFQFDVITFYEGCLEHYKDAFSAE